MVGLADQLWVSVEVKHGSVVLVSQTVHQTTNGDTFGSLLDKMATLEHSTLQVETDEKVTISGPTSGVHVVPLSAPVQMVSPI